MSTMMSDIKTCIQNDNDKSAPKSCLSEQKSPNTSFSMHSHENKEKDVRGDLLHKEDKSKRGKINTDSKTSKDHANKCFNVKKGPFMNKKISAFFCTLTRSCTGEQHQCEIKKEEKTCDPDQVQSEDYVDENYYAKNVLKIVFLMLVVTIALNLIALLIEGLRIFIEDYGLFIAIPYLICIIVMAYRMPLSTYARQRPTNDCLIVLIVILYSTVYAFITAYFKTYFIIQVLFATVVVIGAWIILADYQFDFLMWDIYATTLGIVTFVLIIIYLFSRPTYSYASALLVLTLLNVVMSLIQLQLILGGISISMSRATYHLGAYMVYAAVIQLILDVALFACFIRTPHTSTKSESESEWCGPCLQCLDMLK